jgi:hypothetical protein
MTNSTDPQPLDTVRNQFHEKLIDQLKSTLIHENATNKTILNNVWILNETVVPIVPLNSSTQHCGFFKIKYLLPENDFSVYSETKLKPISRLPKENEPGSLDTSCFSLDVQTGRELANETIQLLKMKHVHAFYAFNGQGMHSLPLIIYPQNELDSNATPAIQKTTCIEQTSNGDLNNLSIFTKWLSLFVSEQRVLSPAESNKPKLLLANTTLHYVIENSTIDKIKELVELCKSERISILFYPIENELDVFAQKIFDKFTEIWDDVLLQYTIKDNPHSELAFSLMFKQALRVLHPKRADSNSFEPVRAVFEDLFKLYPVPTECFDLKDYWPVLSTANSLCHQSSVASDLSEINKNGDDEKCDEYYEEESTNVTASASNTSVTNGFKANSLSEQETNELVEWVDKMSKMGSTCIKYTFLKEMSARGRQNCTPNKLPSYKDIVSAEKKWLDFAKKNKTKFKHAHSCGLNENEYLLRWFDMDFWKMSYYSYVREECKLSSADSVWTMDILQFPYVNAYGLLKAPEKDYDKRPRNEKPRISVIFAFNAAGDYMAPFFVYPYNFSESSDEAPSTTPNNNECFSTNGFVTSRVFESWLSKCFFQHLKESSKPNEENLLLYCSKLDIVDPRNLKLSNENRLNLFCLPNESLMPFNLLFQKSLRKRQVDLFLDSWRKITALKNLSYQFKCKSKPEFFDLFMDAFQNCIEEIGNEQSLDSSTSSSVLDFKNKMINSFEVCQLWPVNYQDYEEYFENAKKKANQDEKDENEVKKSDEPKVNNRKKRLNRTLETSLSETTLMNDSSVGKVENNGLDSQGEEINEPKIKKLKVNLSKNKKMTKEEVKQVVEPTEPEQEQDLIETEKSSLDRIKEVIRVELKNYLNKNSSSALKDSNNQIQSDVKDFVGDLVNLLLNMIKDDASLGSFSVDGEFKIKLHEKLDDLSQKITNKSDFVNKLVEEIDLTKTSMSIDVNRKFDLDDSSIMKDLGTVLCNFYSTKLEKDKNEALG